MTTMEASDSMLSPNESAEQPDMNLEPEVYAHRIFFNHADEYNARHIAEYLTDQMVGQMNRLDLGEAAEEEEVPVMQAAAMTSDKYDCIGTLKYRFRRKTEDFSYTVSEADQKLLEKEILSCGFVIYDITKDPREIPKALAALDVMVREIESVKAIGPKTFKNYKREFVFILISNILTWGRTKPLDPEDPDIPFTEADFRKRKALPNYTDHLACERQVIQKGRKYKPNLRTYVVCCGIPYGFEEDTLFILFKNAWENKNLPIFMPGTNLVPLIHIQDLARVIHAVIELLPTKQYILAVEQIPTKLNKFIRALAASMGQGVQEISREEAFLHVSIDQQLFDSLTVNLKMEPAYILDELRLEYRNDLNLVQNINNIVAEFREARNLEPMKILIHGPVASGRTGLANSIADHYGLHYVNVRTMIDETRETLKTRIDEIMEMHNAKAQLKVGSKHEDTTEDEDQDDEESDDEETGANLKSLQNQLRILETTLENNNNILPDEYVTKLMHSFLASNVCQNQGYVLDGYPKTLQQTKDLFGSEVSEADEEGEEAMGEEDEGDIISKNRSIIPQYVISLEATDEYLADRMMNLPEKFTYGSEYEENNMIERLKFFRDNNTEDNTLLNFFDEHEIHPMNINVMMLGRDMVALFEKVREALGPAIGFEPTPEEQEELAKCQRDAEALKGEQEQIEKELLEHEALKDYQKKMEERIKILDTLQAEEEKILTAQCEPIRSYLMSYVFPTLTQGLLEVARLKPDDPVDYLAEYLFKFNPEGKMFDPAYTRRGELIQHEQQEIKIKKSKLKKLTELCN